MLHKSLKDKVQVPDTNLSEALEVEIKPPQTRVRSKILTEDELKESAQLILESCERKRGTKSHPTENIFQAKLP